MEDCVLVTTLIDGYKSIALALPNKLRADS
jgi:hypothetical protein